MQHTPCILFDYKYSFHLTNIVYPLPNIVKIPCGVSYEQSEKIRTEMHACFPYMDNVTLFNTYQFINKHTALFRLSLLLN